MRWICIPDILQIFTILAIHILMVCLEFHEISWNPRKSLEISWDPLRSLDISWDPLRSLEIPWDLLRSLEIFWDPLSLRHLEIPWDPKLTMLKMLTLLTRLALWWDNLKQYQATIYKIVFRLDVFAFVSPSMPLRSWCVDWKTYLLGTKCRVHTAL